MHLQRVAGMLPEEAREEIQHRALGAVVAGIDHRHTQFEGMMRLVVFHIARQEEIRTRSRGGIYQVAS